MCYGNSNPETTSHHSRTGGETGSQGVHETPRPVDPGFEDSDDEDGSPVYEDRKTGSSYVPRTSVIHES